MTLLNQVPSAELTVSQVVQGHGSSEEDSMKTIDKPKVAKAKELCQLLGYIITMTAEVSTKTKTRSTLTTI